MPKNSEKVKFLADECLGLPTLKLLRSLGYSVVTAKEGGLRGASDLEILKRAIQEDRVLLTEDTDFGNIILYPPELHHGVVLLKTRRREEDQAQVHNTLTDLLKKVKPADFKKTLIVVDTNKYRLRRE